MSACHTSPGDGGAATRSHPLDPVTATEITIAVAAARADGRLGARTRFWGATLDEAYARRVVAGEATGVRLGLVAMDYSGAAAWEIDVRIDGDKGECTGWRGLDPRRPGITSDEARAAAQACRDSPLFRAALARRGIHDVSLVMIDAESMGGFEPERYRDRRVTWGTVWHRTTVADNGYARPVQGVVPIIDMHTMEVLEVEDHGVVPVSAEAGPLATGALGPDRAGLEPLDVVQPQGPSFTVDGRRVAWQGWTFRVGFTHREGLVLYDLEFLGRSVLKRAACNEMYVPYLDPNSTQYRKNFFDWGEYGAGPLTNSLALGCDCLGVIHYFDGVHLGGDGDPVTIQNAICLHEEDAGILWKHNDLRRGVSEVRRSRRLIISNFQTVANYDYGFYWSLHQDGRIELEVKLTGILSASGIAEGDEAPYGRPGSVMARRAPFIHQHLWATPYAPDERFVGGQYPNHAEPGADGVHVWQRQRRSIDGVPLVLWPILGVHHLPRPEQWPVMPVEAIHLVLEPDGFFDRNPALDIPDPAARCC